MVETTNQLAELSRLAQTLNKETDAYTEALAQLESKLRKMNLGVEAWVALYETGQSGGPMRGSYTQTKLGYAKTSEGWGFAVKEVRVERGFFEGDESCPYENQYHEEDPKLLLKSSRELRIMASTRIEYLLKELLDNATAAVKSLREARTLAEQV